MTSSSSSNASWAWSTVTWSGSERTAHLSERYRSRRTSPRTCRWRKVQMHSRRIRTYSICKRGTAALRGWPGGWGVKSGILQKEVGLVQLAETEEVFAHRFVRFSLVTHSISLNQIRTNSTSHLQRIWYHFGGARSSEEGAWWWLRLFLFAVFVLTTSVNVFTTLTRWMAWSWSCNGWCISRDSSS